MSKLKAFFRSICSSKSGLEEYIEAHQPKNTCDVEALQRRYYQKQRENQMFFNNC